MEGLEGWHIVIIVVVAVVLFGSGKLPGAARSLGQSLRIFKSEMRAAVKDEPTPGAEASGVAVAPMPIQNASVAGTIADVPAQTVPQPVQQAVPQPAPQNVPTQQ